MQGAGLRLVTFIEPFRYDPDWLVRDPRVRKRLQSLDPVARASFAELFTGNIKKHIFYAVRQDNDLAPPTTDSPDAVPVLLNQSAEDAGKQMPPGGTITVSIDGMKIDMAVPGLARMMIGLCDGKRTLAEIHTAVQEKRPELDYAAFKTQFDALYRVMNAINKLVLRLPPA